LLHHSDVVPVGEMLSDLAIPHPIHVDVLNLEMPTRRLHTHKHPPADGDSAYAAMRAGVGAANDNPLRFNYGIEYDQLGVRECAPDILEDRSHTLTPNLPTVVSTIFGKRLRSGIDVAAIERFGLLLHQNQVGVGTDHILTS